ncbi:MAG: hypothetical protein KH369_15890 [Paraclostridium bifermentans]|uniref:hypothetical protein n=1 Tax=Paraclostridium bifermentans TaxID=1490 RepID=UPI001DBB3326|nr:hypothetical protein [Paraclostridium bifermentans]MBS6509683.1 hypothetical protein [Paraclostridium bifermentans]
MFKVVSKIRHENMIDEIKESHKKELSQKQNILNDERSKRKEIEAKLRDEIKKGKLKDDEIKRLYQTIESDYDKEINKLEAIAKRTKKPRIRKKCESRILKYKFRKQDLEIERHWNEKRYI